MGIRRLALFLAATTWGVSATAQAQDEEGEDMFDNIGRVDEEEAEPGAGLPPPSPTDELTAQAKQSASSVITEAGGVCGIAAPFKRIAIAAAKVAPIATSLAQSLESLKTGLPAMGDDKDRRALEMELNRAIPAAKAVQALAEAMVMADRGEARPGKAAGPPDSAKGRYEAVAQAHCPAEETAMCVPGKQELQRQFCEASRLITPLSR